MKRSIFAVMCLLLLVACVGPSITGPASFANPPRYGWTKDEVRAHWGPPYSVSYYGAADRWLYRRSYFVNTGYGNVIEAEYASVSFYDGKVVGVSY